MPTALLIFSINLPRVETRGYYMFRADGPFFKYSVAAGSLAEDPAMVCSYI